MTTNGKFNSEQKLGVHRITKCWGNAGAREYACINTETERITSSEDTSETRVHDDDLKVFLDGAEGEKSISTCRSAVCG